MTDPQIAVFRASGTWHKPPGAETVDLILVGAQSGDGIDGEAVLCTFAADDLPQKIEVTVGGRGATGAPSWGWAATSQGTGGGSGGVPASAGATGSPGVYSLGGGAGGGWTGRGWRGRSEVTAADGLALVITRF